MDLNELRETKAKLEHVVNYCPPETASDYAWEATYIAAQNAAERYAELEDSFALLDAVDALTNRVETITTILIKAYGNFSPDCGGDFFLDDCREACADFFTCRRDAELADMVQLLGGNTP